MNKTKWSLTALLFAVLSCIPAGAQISFTPLASQPPDHILSIARDPANASTLYVCTSNRVFKSTNNGASWVKTANPGTITLNVLYCTPSGQLYAGMGTTLGATQVGLMAYNSAADSWTAVAGAPLNVSAIVEDAAGQLVVGTGSTGNFNPNPINFGTGVYRFDGSTWTASNNGLPNLPGFSALPYIKALITSSSGELVAATYGCGVLRYGPSGWTDFAPGLSDVNANALLWAPGDSLYAALDNGIALSAGGAWTNAGVGLPDKPVRCLTRDSEGQLYAGLGFYHWMDGSLAGEIFQSVDGSVSWQPTGTDLQTSDILCLAIGASNKVLAGAAGLWTSGTAGATWTRFPGDVFGAAQVFQVVRTTQGGLFAICDNQPKYFGFGGIFHSEDGGNSWTQVLNGIERHRGNVIFCDSQGNLWAGLTAMSGAGSNGSHTRGALYKSVDNGITWQENTDILVPSLRFSGMKESSTGKLYVSNGWGGPSNVSASSDYETWSNDLNGGLGNGGMVFGLAVNPAGDVFIGTETQGIMRSLNDGTGPFTTVSPLGGNCSVFVDPYTGFVFGGVPGADPNGRYFRGSQPADNGANMFLFENFPAYTGPSAMVFDNRGNLYMTAASLTFANSGFYTAPSGWDSSTVFTKIMANANVSYYFTSMLVDPCGYIYGAQAGAGIYKSNQPVNTPVAPILQTPADGSTGVSPTPPMTWTHACVSDNFRLQIATDSTFGNVVLDTALNWVAFDVPAQVLNSNTEYFWRVYAVNAAGVGDWSASFRFTTGTFTGVGENGAAGQNFTLYPNPAQEEVSLLLTNGAAGEQFRVLDVFGQTVLFGASKGRETQVDVRSLADGLYYFRIKGMTIPLVKF